MDPTIRSIIHTIAFHDAVGKVPLTKVELYKYLVNSKKSLPASPKTASRGGPHASFSDFAMLVDEEWQELNPYIARYRGFYFLKKNNGAYKKRIEVGKTSIKKWRIAKNMSRIISFLPYVRMVAVTGSLTRHTTNRDSDIDMLITAKAGHIWTTRFIVSAAMQILGKRRYGKKIKDRICLNHYIADNALALRPKHLFSAHICASSIALWSKNQTHKSFADSNRALVSLYLPRLKERCAYFKSTRIAPRFLYISSSVVEYLLTKTVSQKLESLLRALQTNKIRANIAKKQINKEEVIFDDRALVFHHPRPQNQKALFLYRENLKELCL